MVNCPLVTHQHHWQLGLVQDGHRLQHIAHEGLRVCTAWCVNYVEHHGGKGRCKEFCDDCPRCTPGEDLNLPWSVYNDVLQGRVSRLLYQLDHLQVGWNNKRV